MFCDASRLCLLSHHEAGDVLQKEKRDVPLAAELDEVSSLESALRKQNPVVADHADWGTVEAAETTNQCITVPAKLFGQISFTC